VLVNIPRDQWRKGAVRTRSAATLHADVVTYPSTVESSSVSVTFNTDGAAKMFRASQSHIGQPLAILVDGEVVIAPVVRSPITTSAIITGNYTRAEAERIVAGILGR
jgi:preprotein translocase subunit SecD